MSKQKIFLRILMALAVALAFWISMDRASNVCVNEKDQNGAVIYCG